MSDVSTTPLTLPAAARALGVHVRVLRDGIRGGRVPAPPSMSATSALPAEWLASARAAVEASPKRFTRALRQRVPAFARYEGTSCWRKYPTRVREYAGHQAAQARASAGS